MLLYHMHKFLSPLSVENLSIADSFFVLTNFHYFINLSDILYTDRTTCILKKY